MSLKIISAIALILFFIPQAFAETEYTTRAISSFLFKELVPSLVSVKVMKVIDPLTFIGEDKNIYVLGGIEVPNAATSKADITAEAAKTLAGLIEGKDVKFYLTKNKNKGRLNHMNQSVIQAVIKQGNIWVQGEMLALGMARVRTTPSNPELSADMLKLESEARAVKKGLWVNDNLQVLTAETAPGKENSFQLVEGTPKAAAVTRNMIYLNFAEDYKKDFTIGIPTSLRTSFARHGIDPLRFAHTPLRVRGWVQSYNGPFIEIDHVQQIEILGKLSPFSSLPAQEPAPGKTGMRSISLPLKPVVQDPEKPQTETPEPPNTDD